MYKSGFNFEGHTDFLGSLSIKKKKAQKTERQKKQTNINIKSLFLN